jgi:long-chain fatty acid transport protein
VLAAALLSPMFAHATNGYFSHGYGIKSQGIAGIGIALPQDSLAAATNPAGTALVGDRVDLGLTWFQPKRGAEIVNNSFNNGGPRTADGNYDGNDTKSFFIPEFGYTKQLSSTVGVGVAVYGNGGMNTDYASNPFAAWGSSGKASINLEQLYISPSVAWKPNAQNSFGAALNFAYQRFEAKGLGAFDFPGNSASAYPGSVYDRGRDSSTGWGLRLGWIGQISQDLSLGLTWSSKIKATKFDKYKGLFADAGSFDIPENYGIGIAYKATPALTLAADAQEIKYGSVRSVANPLANLPNGLGSVNGAGFGWKDIAVIKLGASYDYSKDLTLRAGISHSGQPIPADQTFFNILAPGVVQDHLTFGATWKTSTGELSLSYFHGFKKTVNGSNSIPRNDPPAGFGGGEANIHLEEDGLGIAYGWKL